MSAASWSEFPKLEAGGAESRVTAAGVWLQSSVVQARIDRLAAAPSTVLISGETGSGKGLIARLVHGRSLQRRYGFTHVDCAALSPYLIESELFGHVRGAFTGATAARSGRFQSAGAGTIFLDEVAELGLDCQRKLLRVLEDRVFERVGSSEPVAMRARVIAGTNRNLHAAMADGRFRQDLFYRLAVTQFHVPPLRDRLDDMPELVLFALRRAAERLGRSAPSTTNDFMLALLRHTWPGNVRELLNVVEQVMVYGEPNCSVLRESDLSGVLSQGAVNSTNGAHACPNEGSDTTRLEAALIQTAGNVSRAARRMGVPRSTLRYRITRAGLTHLLSKD